MTTKTKTKKASAPETRINEKELARLHSVEWVKDQKVLREIAAREQRTIPAEKPTAMLNTSQAFSWKQARLEELQDWYLSACKGRQEAQTEVALLQAQAAQLAEALRDLINVTQRIGPPAITQGGLCEEEDWATATRKATQALAAYEEGK